MKKRFIALSIVLLGLPAQNVFATTYEEAISSRYPEDVYRKLTPDEIGKLTIQNAMKSISCDEYFIDKRQSIDDAVFEPDDYSLLKKKSILPQGKLICVFSYNKKTRYGSVSMSEIGVVDGIAYELESLADGKLYGNIGSLYIGCEAMPAWKDRATGKKSVRYNACYLNTGDYFTLQRVPAIKPFDIPEGYLVSVGGRDYLPLITVSIDGKTFKTNHQDGLFWGKDATHLISTIKDGSTITYTYAWPYAKELSGEQVKYDEVPEIRAGFKMLDPMYVFFKSTSFPDK